MKGLRIKQPSGKSSFDLEPNEESHLEGGCLKITISEWLSDGNAAATIHLSLEQSSKLYDYLGSYLEEKKEALEIQQERIKQIRSVLTSVYKEAQKSGLVTFEHIKQLSSIKTPMVALLAKDLHVPASEIPLIVENTPLPFALLKKHFKTCWEAVLTEPCPANLMV